MSERGLIMKKGALVSVGYFSDGSRMPDEKIKDIWGFIDLPMAESNKFANKSSTFLYPIIKVFGPNDFLEGGEEKHANYSYINLEPFYGIYLGKKETIAKVFGLVDRNEVTKSELIGIFLNGVIVFVSELWVQQVSNIREKRMIKSDLSEEAQELTKTKLSDFASSLSKNTASRPGTKIPTNRVFALENALTSTTPQFVKEIIVKKFIAGQLEKFIAGQPL